MFLQMMIDQHEGAIEMSRVELAQGANAEARQLAGAITAAQEQEIGEMQALLARV